MRYFHVLLCSLLLAYGPLKQGAAQAVVNEQITIDAGAPGTPFPHFWEQMFGSGRANLVLRSAYREDLHAVHDVTGLRFVRGHGILDDENGVYTEDEQGRAVYNFAYVDQIYDNLLKEHVRPVVELSFMPKKLAFNPDALHPFWYKPNVSPPKSMERWDALIVALGKHLVERFGLEEVSQWYFEVWNEPNIDFWNGIPREDSYFDLYDHTARDLKSVNPRLRVGGPATAAASWVNKFLAYTNAHHTPVDFVSSHGYADDTIANLFPSDEQLPVPHPPADTPMNDRVCLAIHKVRAQMRVAGHADMPLFWTEWNVQGASNARDTPFVGPALANTIRQCDGAVQMMSFWTFSDVFEEGGPISNPLSGQFGLRAEYGINKASFYDFSLLHQLGEERLANTSQHVLVTRDARGDLVIAAWNIVPPALDGQPHQSQQAQHVTMELTFEGTDPEARVTLERVDEEHGNVLPYYAAMGSPQYPSPAQVAALNQATALHAPTRTHLAGSKLALDLGPNALILLKIPSKQ